MRLNSVDLYDFQLHLVVQSIAFNCPRLVRHSREAVRLRHGVDRRLLLWHSRLLLRVVAAFGRLALKC